MKYNFDVEFFSTRAEHYRQQAEQSCDPEMRRLAFALAEAFDKLADIEERDASRCRGE